MFKLTCFQVTIWGDYGRVEGAKVFMGVAQILLDNLDLSELVIGWYKLFGTSSLVSVPPGGGKELLAGVSDFIDIKKGFDRFVSF
jgi:regulating synaptic membrane exocytosis protein 2